jgi:hypothetical protein
MAGAAAMLISACGGGDDHAAPEPTPAPALSRFVGVAPSVLAAPTHVSSPLVEYQLGTLPVRGTAPSPTVFLTSVHGAIRYPQATLAKSGRVNHRWPIVILLHGNHEVTDPSYLGYDYLATNLAEHGYVAVSIDANDINGNMHPDDNRYTGDYSSVSRGQLILATLDKLRELDQNGGEGWQAALKDQLDFDRIGVMGHSRGGQGLINAFKFNLQRDSVTPKELAQYMQAHPELFTDYTPVLQAANEGQRFLQAAKDAGIFFSPTANTTRPYNFRGGILLGTTDFQGTVGLANIPLAVVIPSCDGDVRDLQGARTFDNNRYGFEYDTAPNLQVLVRGANHNYYNTEWRRDDMRTLLNYAPAFDLKPNDINTYCDEERSDSSRMNAEDQRRGGQFLINGFMRNFVGGEAAFAPYWNGLAQLPEPACPAGEWPCDARHMLTVQQEVSQRMSVHRFEYSDSLQLNDLGGAVTLNGFDASALCQMPFGGAPTGPECLPQRLPGFAYQRGLGGLRSIAEHAELAWSRPGASFSTALNDLDTRRMDSLTFRIAVVLPFGQEVEATLTDTAGRSATVKASRYSDALYLGPTAPRSGSVLIPDAADAPFASGQVAQLMNMVALPLDAFTGVDKQHLQSLRLTLPAPGGKIALSDVQFQRLGR